MDLKGVPYPTMDWESSNLPDAWNKLMFDGPLKGSTGKEQCAYILLWIGDRGRTIHTSWNLNDEQNKVAKTIFTKCKEFCEPKANPVIARYKFYRETQSSEPIDEYIARLTIIAKYCDFGTIDHTDEMIRDRIVFGCSSEKVREKLLAKGKDLTKEDAIQIVQSYEFNRKQLQEMKKKENELDVVWVRKQKPIGKRSEPQYGSQSNTGWRRRKKPEKREHPDDQCSRCEEKKHKRREDCEAWGQTCNKFSKYNHFAKMCKTYIKHVNYVQNEEYCGSDSSDSEFFVHTVSRLSSRPDNAVVQISVGKNDTKIKAKIDTGSQVNILPSQLFQQTDLHYPLSPSDSKLTSYTGNQLTVLGKVRMQSSYKETRTHAEFYIVDQVKAPALINLQTASELGLIKLTYAIEKQSPDKSAILSEFNDVFQGIGTFQGKCSIELKENADPIVCPVRKIPFALQDKLKDELQSMESQGIICKVIEPTDWVNALVCVEKCSSDKLRLCKDPKLLNDSIKRPYYPMCTLTDITSKLHGAKYFSVLDATKCYYSCQLSEKSSLLTTFATPFGRYKYNRLPMGLRSSEDIFNRKMDEVLEGLSGVASIVDDVLCWGNSKAEHDANLRRLHIRAREKGLKFNPEKLVISQTEVTYFGHVTSDKGMTADKDKIAAIINMKTPESRQELKFFSD